MKKLYIIVGIVILISVFAGGYAFADDGYGDDYGDNVYSYHPMTAADIENATGLTGVTLIKDGFGTHIQLQSQPTATQLEKLDIYMSTEGLARENGTSIIDKVNEIDASIAKNGSAIETMSASLPEPEPEPEVNPIRDLISRWRNR